MRVGTELGAVGGGPKAELDHVRVEVLGLLEQHRGSRDLR